MISRIVLIPKELVQNRVLTFLEMQDLVWFDSAILNHRLRPLLLEQLTGAQLNTDSMKIDAESARWFLERGIRISSLYVKKMVKDLSTLKQLVRSVGNLVCFDNFTAAETIDDFLKNCERIESFSFRRCCGGEMKGSVLASIGAHCKELQRIDLSYSRWFLLPDLVPLLTGCASLRDLNLTYCSGWVNNDCIRMIATHCPQLQSLRADNCNSCGDSAIQVLAQHCHDLRHLSLQACSLLTDEGVSALVACKELRSVDISACTRITSQGISTLAQGCTKLEEISIPECDKHLHLAIAALAQHCLTLHTVRCFSAFFTERSIQSLQNCRLLHTLEITEIYHLTFMAVLALLDHCAALERLELPLSVRCYARASPPVTVATSNSDSSTAVHNRLAYINIARFTSLTDSVFLALIRRCPNITQLNLMACTKLTDASMVAVASHCRKLQTINISNICSVSDAGVYALARGCYFIRTFSAVGCVLLTDEAAFALSSHCPNLRSFNMSICTKVTDDGIVCILQKCRLLRELQLSCSNNVTRQVLDTAVQYGARLRYLNLSSCSKIDAFATNAFRIAKPNCALLH